MRGLLLAVVGVLFFVACKQKQPEAALPVSREEGVVKNLERLKKEVVTGDLVVRLGDDLLSYQIKFLNEKDQSYSHAGIVVEKGAEKLIAHITPDDPQKDGIQYTSIDSFLNPAKNLSCALYRYNLTPAERDSFAMIIDGYKTEQTLFDRVYDLSTDNEMYCSEMISKGIKKATYERIQFREVNVPVRMQAALYNHFNKQLSKQTIAQRKIMTVDNLYQVPECKQVMQFTLKFLPGQ